MPIDPKSFEAFGASGHTQKNHCGFFFLYLDGIRTHRGRVSSVIRPALYLQATTAGSTVGLFRCFLFRCLLFISPRYWKHLNTKLFQVRYSDGPVFRCPVTIIAIRHLNGPGFKPTFEFRTFLVWYSDDGLNNRAFNNLTKTHDLNTQLVHNSNPHCIKLKNG